MARKSLCFLCSILVLCNITLASNLPEISADGAILIDTKTDTILYSKNMRERFYPASTTKVLTALAIVQDLALDQIITKTQDAVNNVPSDSSQIGLNVGDQYSVRDGLHAVLMASDNFVCYDLAVEDSGSIESFASKMNALAVSCGATKSNFVNPHGYHSPLHYTTPYSLSQIALNAFSNPIVEDIAGTFQYDFTVSNTGRKIQLQHTAALLNPASSYYNKNVVAAKTGYHTPAGRTLVAKAVYDDIELIAVVMRTEAPLQFEDINKLFKYGSENFSVGSDSETGDYYLINSSYSDWAKPYIERALEESWITNTGFNYSSAITARQFGDLIKSSIFCKECPPVDSLIQYNGDSIYKENLSTNKAEIAEIIYKYLSNLDLIPLPETVSISDINELSSLQQEAIRFCVQSKLLSVDGSLFSPYDEVSYEEAIYLICQLSDIVSRYHSYSFPA